MKEILEKYCLTVSPNIYYFYRLNMYRMLYFTLNENNYVEVYLEYDEDDNELYNQCLTYKHEEQLINFIKTLN